MAQSCCLAEVPAGGWTQILRLSSEVLSTPVEDRDRTQNPRRGRQRGFSGVMGLCILLFV